MFWFIRNFIWNWKKFRITKAFFFFVVNYRECSDCIFHSMVYHVNFFFTKKKYKTNGREEDKRAHLYKAFYAVSSVSLKQSAYNSLKVRRASRGNSIFTHQQLTSLYCSLRRRYYLYLTRCMYNTF